MGSIAVDTTPGVEYKLGRGGPEAVRLTAQHHTMVTRQGYLLHPTIAASIKHIPEPRIADVATGTGIWAVDLGRKMPHAKVIGLDISDAQYPPRWTVPSNVSFDLYDLLQEVPVELQGAFDVVHIRLLLAAGPAVDKKIFIDRFRALLRPGGWLQWDELSYPNMTACFPSKEGITTVPLDDHPAVLAMSKYIALKDRLNWIHDFESVIAECGGYDCIRKDVAPRLMHLLQTETDLNIAVITSILNCFIKNKNVADAAMLSDIKDALARFYADVEAGVLFSNCWNVCTARKI